MNREAVFEQLKIDEGVVYELYNDHPGYATFGVRHPCPKRVIRTRKTQLELR